MSQGGDLSRSDRGFLICLLISLIQFPNKENKEPTGSRGTLIFFDREVHQVGEEQPHSCYTPTAADPAGEREEDGWAMGWGKICAGSRRDIANNGTTSANDL